MKDKKNVPLTAEERRRLIEAPVQIRIIGSSYGWGGHTSIRLNRQQRQVNEDLESYSWYALERGRLF